MKLSLRRAGHALALSALALACAALCPVAYAAGDDSGKIDTGFPGLSQGAAPKSAATPAVDPAKPIAKVNGETIHQSDIDKYMDMVQEQVARMQMQGRPVPPTAVDDARKKAPVAVVRQKLVEQAIKAEESKITDAELAKELDSLRAFMKLENHDLDKELVRSGKSIDDLKADVRKQMALNKLLQDEMGVKPPTEAELKEAYDAAKAHGNTVVPEQVVASHILIGFDGNPRDPNHKPPTDAEKAEKKKKAEDVLAQAKKGEDFAKLAKANSTDPSNKDTGGELGAFGRGMMTKNFEQAAFDTKPGKLSDVVETEFGYHIIKVTDHTATKTLSQDDMKYPLAQQVETGKVQSKMPELIADLQKKGKIEMLDGSTLPPVDMPPAGAAAGSAQ